MRRLITLSIAVLLCAPLSADRLVTLDGRILTVKKARKLADGNYHLTFENGEVLCPEKLVKTVEIEEDMSDYVPQNEDERKKLDQGFVRYRGKWLSKSAYQAELNKEAEERRSRVSEIAAHSEFHSAYEKETKHFRVKTNTSKELADFYGDLLESYYDLMDKRLGINPTPTLSRTKMRVNIYKNYDDWVANNELGAGGGVVGYFFFINESLNFFHDYDDPTFTEWVGLHECTHLLTYLIDPQAWPAASSIWVNEGVADFFGSSEVEKDAKGRIAITPGKLQVDRILTVQQAIEKDEYVRLEDLFRTDRSRFFAFQYAHAWSFVYFLNNSTKQYEQGFKRFFKDFYTIPKGVPYTWEPFPNKAGTAKIMEAEDVRKLLLDALKVKDVESLEKEWIAFISSIKIDGADALFKRAYSALRQGDSKNYEQATKDIEAAISAGFEDPRAYWIRGLLKSWVAKGGVQAGLDDLRKAVEMAPLQATFRYSLGQALAGYRLGIGGFIVRVVGDKELYGTDEQIEEAKKQLGLTCELDSENDYYQESNREFLERYERWKAEGTSQK